MIIAKEMIIVKRQYATRCENGGCCKAAHYEINKISLCDTCLAELSVLTAKAVSEIITKRSESKC